MFNTKTSKILLSIGTILFFGVGFIFVQAFAIQASQPSILLNEMYDSVSISATFDPKTQTANAIVSYDYLNPQSVQEYIDFCRETSNKIAQGNNDSVFTRVIFNRPLSQKEFEAFVNRYPLQVHYYRMRAVEPDGTRVTIDGAPINNELIPIDYLNHVQDDIQERNNAEFKGWVQVDITTDTSNFAKMQQDPDVFITEATYTLIQEAMATQTEALENAGVARSVIQKIQALSSPEIQITGPVLYWSLEDMGLVPMPTHSQSDSTN